MLQLQTKHDDNGMHQLQDWISKKSQFLRAQSGLKRLNKGASPKYPDLEALCNVIDINLIQWSFKCCGISNKHDKTEDKLIFNYNYLDQTSQPNDEIKLLNEENQEINDTIAIDIVNKNQETFNEIKEINISAEFAEEDNDYYIQNKINYYNLWDD
ncbi:20993_t:CDS:2 [Cetraspora pellucida]|uniref:20993_t:CDS:1 n=1 Tax=Cetraspora pellucida TaxID=1433469 RepID=A0A9N9CAI3_9GLOM|nr:20993_t:CDS:2 [Cetraspora pellucida]